MGDGAVYHPILLMRAQLDFDPAVPEFTISDAGRDVDLYTGLFRTISGFDGKLLARFREDLAAGGYEPLGGDATSQFLERIVVQLSPQAQFKRDALPRADADPPRSGAIP